MAEKDGDKIGEARNHQFLPTKANRIPGKDRRPGVKFDGQRILIGNGTTSDLWGTWGNLIGHHPHNLH